MRWAQRTFVTSTLATGFALAVSPAGADTISSLCPTWS
jgi:hypothetical protein